jgi:hypothetical protein
LLGVGASFKALSATAVAGRQDREEEKKKGEPGELMVKEETKKGMYGQCFVHRYPCRRLE